MLLNAKANPQFERYPYVQNGEHLKFISVNYKPFGFWTDTAITVRIDFKGISSAAKVASDFVCEGNPVKFAIGYSGGGQDSKLNIDPITTIENFQSALNDAVGIVKYVKESILNGASFLDIAKELIGLDMPGQERDQYDFVFVDIGDDKIAGCVAGCDAVFSDAKTAQQWLGDNFSVSVREATLREENYWWFLLRNQLIEIDPK